ncbi:hypothetical protein V1264_012143 [Littorina saxatilis]|uniref:Uncharacterized protein n=1 Tax=Littorina saxatilis TaxID=31220 RepID=A0AAN9GLA2_9CAEN
MISGATNKNKILLLLFDPGIIDRVSPALHQVLIRRQNQNDPSNTIKHTVTGVKFTTAWTFEKKLRSSPLPP